MSIKPARLKLLADECVGAPAIKLLRKSGYALVTASEAGLCAKNDPDVLLWAIKNGCVLLTENTDFGNILLYPPKLHTGIILLRYRHKEENEIHSVLLTALRELSLPDLDKTLVIVDSEKFRVRRE